MSVKINGERGEITLANDVFITISGWLATNCFGVRGMAARSVSDGLVQLLQRDNLSKGIKVSFCEKGTVRIELHIIVEHGVNIPALSEAIMNEVSYRVNRLTGVEVSGVDVFVDAITTEK
ncbi:MAG: Asp23/Gls24 family envelope stress response protein [Oscillospiraceae bacterium]|nr:Asp23/Gls24 family envelope stress response protein [Oscillospiraceae bacterium]